MGQIIADFWRRTGAQVEERPVAGDRAQDLEQLAALPGAWFTNPRYYQMTQDRYHTRSIPTAATRWTGRNRGGYSNPRADDLMDRLVATIRTVDRLPLHEQLVREVIGDVAFMPLYWEYDPYLFVKGMQGIRGGLWNVETWDRA
jgi:ABC-type transport system substrate-binding protein